MVALRVAGLRAAGFFAGGFLAAGFFAAGFFAAGFPAGLAGSVFVPASAFGAPASAFGAADLRVSIFRSVTSSLVSSERWPARRR